MSRDPIQKGVIDYMNDTYCELCIAFMNKQEEDNTEVWEGFLKHVQSTYENDYLANECCMDMDLDR